MARCCLLLASVASVLGFVDASEDPEVRSLRLCRESLQLLFYFILDDFSTKLAAFEKQKNQLQITELIVGGWVVTGEQLERKPIATL